MKGRRASLTLDQSNSHHHYQLNPAQRRRNLGVFPCFSDAAGLVQLLRRCRTLKRDEHAARFFPHSALVRAKNEKRDLEAGPAFAKTVR
jgi:hypothetical protein